MMDSERWNRVLDLVPDALALPEEEREAFLDKACRSREGSIDPVLRREVDELIAASLEEEKSEVLQPPLPGLAVSVADAQGLTRRRMPDHIGPWQLVRRLGSGGMGIVYEAVRADESFTQRAALKLIRPGFVDDFRNRFIRERALLAGLTHPGIARLIDGGLSDEGTPYLAMELVEGRALTRYASDNHLPVEQRLKLFLQVCDAVAFAHRNLVVHRDLKPANIYVHEGGEEPVVKLLDFGIARLLECDTTLVTMTGHSALTPAYAAPEQLTGRSITTATDVYALGVVLYELLTGQHPHNLTGKTAAQIEQVVATTVPAPPSAVVAPNRPPLRGDLDQLVLKALNKDPARRYPSAEALGDDIRRYLDKRPVLARPDALSYRLGKFIQRNRVEIGIGVTIMISIIVLATVFALALTRERNRAEAAAEEAQAIAGFLEQILRAPNSRWYNDATATGPNTPIKAVLDEAAAKIDEEFGDQPALQADLHHILGDTYSSLGLAEEAGRHHRRVLTLREQLYSPPHPKLAEALYYAAVPAATQGDMVLRIERLHRAINMQRVRNEGNNFPFMLQEFANFLIAGQEADRADILNKEALDFVNEVFVPGHEGYRYRNPQLMTLSLQRAEIYLLRDQVQEAEVWMMRSDSVRRQSGEERSSLRWRQADSCTWHSSFIWGSIFMHQERYAQAEQLFLQCWGETPHQDQTPLSVSQERAAFELVNLYEAWGRSAAANPYRMAADQYRRQRDSWRAVYHRWRAANP